MRHDSRGGVSPGEATMQLGRRRGTGWPLLGEVLKYNFGGF